MIEQSKGQLTIHLRTIQKLFKKLKEDQSITKRKLGSGRPTCPFEQFVLELINEDCYLSCKTIAEGLNISKQSVCNILKRNNYSYKWNQWIPRTLTEKQRQTRVEMSQILLKRLSKGCFPRHGNNL